MAGCCVRNMCKWTCYLLFLVSSSLVSASKDSRIKFTSHSDRPVRDPDGPLIDGLPIRRSFWSPRDTMCRTAGSTAGALAANRLTSSGQLSPGEHIPGHVLLDLRSFVSIVSAAAIRGIDESTGCSLAILQPAAEEMCMKIICSSGGSPVPRERCVAMALNHNGVISSMPTLQQHLPKSSQETCSSSHFNFKINRAEFASNPKYYASQLVMGVMREVQEIHNHLIASNARPLDLPPPAGIGEQNYVQRAVQGVVIATYVCKVVTEIGNIVTEPDQYHHDVSAFFSYIIGRIIRKIGVKPMQEAIRAHNVALKMTLYWLINNFQLVKNSPPGLLTGNSLMALGLAQYFPSVPPLYTNDNLVDPLGKYVFFPLIQDALEPTSIIIEEKIPFWEILNDIQVLLPHEPVTAPEEIIILQVEPIQKPSSSNVPTRVSPLDPLRGVDGAKGTLPYPEDWFSVNAPSKNATSIRDNAVLLGTLATVIGVHAGKILPQLGIVTRGNEAGYQDLTDLDVYDVIQKVNQELVSRLMSVIPISLDTGFAILNGAFKTTKITLNLENAPEKNPETHALIPIGLKYHNLLKFYPELQALKWDLYPIPTKLHVLHLWARPIFDVDLKQALKTRIDNLASSRFPKVLSDIVAIFKYHVPSLNVFNIRTLPEKIGDSLPWDPPEVISYLYDPCSADGVPTVPYIHIEAPKKTIQCPGHIMCPPGALSPCGHYICASSDPWCYFPEEIKCPGSIQCPVIITVQESLIECPGDLRCPFTQITCPGGSECSDAVSPCPGRHNCPLLIKCPGTLCPTRYTTRPQLVLPCPQHSMCSQPPPDTILCQNDMACAYPTTATMHQSSGGGREVMVQVAVDNSQLAAAIRDAGQSISATIEKKQMSVQINNTALTNLSLDGKKIASSASGNIIMNGKAASASAASAAAGPSQHEGEANNKTASASGSAAYSPDRTNPEYPDYYMKPASVAAAASTSK